MNQVYGTALTANFARLRRELLAKAVDLGITFFDTAEVYGLFLNGEEIWSGARACGPLRRRGRDRHQASAATSAPTVKASRACAASGRSRPEGTSARSPRPPLKRR
ncbi:hypothetical protein ACRAWD_28635, partial [Caulobacter segnis]